VYTDDCLIFDVTDQGIDKCIRDLKLTFNVEDEGSIEDYLGVQVTKQQDGSILLSQPDLIDSILMDMGLIGKDGRDLNGVKSRSMPSLSTKRIGPDLDGPPFGYDWHYRSLIGKLNFLEKSTRMDISYATHQCARFLSDPKQSHGVAVKHIGRYLLATRNRGVILRPDNSNELDCCVDADITRNWNSRIAEDDRSPVRDLS